MGWSGTYKEGEDDVSEVSRSGHDFFVLSEPPYGPDQDLFESLRAGIRVARGGTRRGPIVVSDVAQPRIHFKLAARALLAGIETEQE
jgi:hypothetical protein